MPRQLIEFSKGLVTSRDPSTLKPGELAKAEGIEYREGSSHVYRLNGRASTSTSLQEEVVSLHKFRYDHDEDKIIAFAGGKIFESDVFDKPNNAGFGGAVLAGLTKTAIPEFASLKDSWVMINGTDRNHLREGDGTWRTVGMYTPTAPLSLASAPAVGEGETATSSSGDYINPDNANADDTTHAYGLAETEGSIISHEWTFAADVSGPEKIIRITHQGTTSFGDETNDIVFAAIEGVHMIKVTDSGGTLDIPISIFSLPYAKMTTDINVGSIDLTTVTVRLTTEFVDYRSAFGFVPADPVYCLGRVFTITADNNASDIEFTSASLTYSYTERFKDEKGVIHESNLARPLLEIGPQTGVFGIKLSGFPINPHNDLTTEYVVYRSLGIIGGGYPFLYQVGEVRVDGSTTTWTDIGNISFTLAAEQRQLYETLNILYPDGSSFSMEINGPPPPSKKAVPFQNSMVYIPVFENRIYYSLPGTIANAAIEKVPSLYYLEFVTPYNDTVVGAQVANSGRSLIVYFPRYSMLVNRIPQASDPGVFDQRITEYISNTRGAAGPHATAEFTINVGRTFAAAIDSLGLWVTDGISTIQEWSTDLDWSTLTKNVDLRRVRLFDNTEMYRLEMLYEEDGQYKEIHFFYGSLKEDGSPAISGPHLTSKDHSSGISSKHYFVTEAGKWVGVSGGRKGDVFVERAKDDDDSLGYDGHSGAIGYDLQTGDYYIGGFSQATLLTFGYPKFGDGKKLLEGGFVGSFRRDGYKEAQVSVKDFYAGVDKKIYWHRYADRHNLRITNATEGTIPALVGYEVEVRGVGEGKE
jgi:hypothetical protein